MASICRTMLREQNRFWFQKKYGFSLNKLALRRERAEKIKRQMSKASKPVRDAFQKRLDKLAVEVTQEAKTIRKPTVWQRIKAFFKRLFKKAK